MAGNVNSFISKLHKELETSVNRINNSTVGAQRKIYAELLDLLKQLEVDSNGQIKNSVQNIIKISSLKQRINAAILNKEWIKSSGDFVKAFDVVSQLQSNYFSTLISDFNPPQVLDAVKQDAITSVLDQLRGDGVKVSVAKGVEDILRRNIKSGASFADMVDTMRSYIVKDSSGDGILQRYVKQITTDAINQYSATYNKVVVDDLGFEWFRYTGSNLETTREFCTLMTDKDYFHISELKTILAGTIDGQDRKSTRLNSSHRT